MAISITVNSEIREVDVDPQCPLLWVLRDDLGLTGTKYGCGKAQCGACTVHFNGSAMRSCVLPAGAIGESEVTTIEGISGPVAEAVMAAWIAEEVAQCGYCQPGQVMAATALLQANPHPDDEQIDRAMQGNICRCATYYRIRKAIHRAAAALSDGDEAA